MHAFHVGYAEDCTYRCGFKKAVMHWCYYCSIQLIPVCVCVLIDSFRLWCHRTLLLSIDFEIHWHYLWHGMQTGREERGRPGRSGIFDCFLSMFCSKFLPKS